MNSSPLIEVAELLKIRNNSDIVISDASNGVNARSNFDKLHLENALFVDLNSQLAEVQADLSNGGRHPLPSFSKFEETLSSLGLSEKSPVIIYDHTNSSNAAARFWWMLTAIGHPKVQVLNGGFHNAIEQNYPSNNSLTTIKKVGSYKIDKWLLPVTNLLEVKQYSMDKSFAIIDVRESGRYLGEFENLDVVAGHIPNAINIPSELLEKLLESKAPFAHEDQKVLFVCPVGDQSKKFAAQLSRIGGRGFTLSGGLASWRSANTANTPQILSETAINTPPPPIHPPNPPDSANI
jgi:thiosulfate/3-mercaptopyruvate sulfurtransferase